MTNKIYTLNVNEGEVTCDFTNREKALAVAKAKIEEGAFSVRVYHYTNEGVNSHDDFWFDIDQPENELFRDDGQFGMGA